MVTIKIVNQQGGEQNFYSDASPDITVSSGDQVSFDISSNSVASLEQVGEHLQISFNDGTSVVLNNYFSAEGEQSQPPLDFSNGQMTQTSVNSLIGSKQSARMGAKSGSSRGDTIEPELTGGGSTEESPSIIQQVANSTESQAASVSMVAAVSILTYNEQPIISKLKESHATTPFELDTEKSKAEKGKEKNILDIPITALIAQYTSLGSKVLQLTQATHLSSLEIEKKLIKLDEANQTLIGRGATAQSAAEAFFGAAIHFTESFLQGRFAVFNSVLDTFPSADIIKTFDPVTADPITIENIISLEPPIQNNLTTQTTTVSEVIQGINTDTPVEPTSTQSSTSTAEDTSNDFIATTTEETLTIDVNDAPVVNNQTFTVNENSANSTVVNTVVATDPDTTAPDNTLTYAITAGNTNSAFAINANTGQITVNDSTELDFETTSSFSLTVSVTDGGTDTLSDTATITINLTDITESINVSSLDGSDGFTITGVAASDLLREVGRAGDINGDGLSDIIISARFTESAGTDRGTTYVIFGNASGFSATVDADDVAGTINGKVFNGIDDSDRSGPATSIGDINNDGLDDLMVVAQAAGSSRGEAYVIYGSTGNETVSLSSISADSGASGFRIDGAAALDEFGTAFNKAGDVNGDGIDDFIITAFLNDDPTGNNNGKTYIVYGADGNLSNTGSGTLSLATLNGTTGFAVTGITVGDGMGTGADTAGDFNGDGIGDIIIGAFLGEPSGEGDSNRGETYIIFGQANQSATISASTADITLIGTTNNERTGHNTSSLGDINNDGFDDIAVSSGNGGSGNVGTGYVVFGSSSLTGSVNLSSLATDDNGFAVTISSSETGTNSGFNIEGIGDVNGDFIADYLVGARIASDTFGDAYVVFGQDQAASAFSDIELRTDLDGSNGFIINGDSSDTAGVQVGSAGDMNGDGLMDILVGAGTADPNTVNNAGEVYIIYGANFNNSISQLGDANANTLTGTSGADIIFGAQGNDTLNGADGADKINGGSGADILAGGLGNDILVFDLVDTSINGGAGTDIIRPDQDNADLNLTTTSIDITNIETIDLKGTGSNELTLNVQDVLDITDSGNSLFVDGNSADTVTASGGWAAGGTTTVNSITYNIYTSGSATLNLEDTMNQTVT